MSWSAKSVWPMKGTFPKRFNDKIKIPVTANTQVCRHTNKYVCLFVVVAKMITEISRECDILYGASATVCIIDISMRRLVIV